MTRNTPPPIRSVPIRRPTPQRLRFDSCSTKSPPCRPAGFCGRAAPPKPDPIEVERQKKRRNAERLREARKKGIKVEELPEDPPEPVLPSTYTGQVRLLPWALANGVLSEGVSQYRKFCLCLEYLSTRLPFCVPSSTLFLFQSCLFFPPPCI